MTEELKILWQEMADFTRSTCMKPSNPDFLEARKNGDCIRPGSCCSPEYCEFALETAEEMGETLARTTNPTLPLMGPDGCVAPPHVRPMCTLHVCCINSLGFKPGDPEWTKKYFDLREKLTGERC